MNTAVTQEVTNSNGVALGTKQATLRLNIGRVKALLITVLISHLMAANIRYCFEAHINISGPSSYYGNLVYFQS